MPSKIRRHPVSWIAFVLCLVCSVVQGPARAQEAGRRTVQGREIAVWSAIIPSAFPGNLYTWRLLADGTYREEGRDARSGRAIQSTLSGRWEVEGTRMILRQRGIGYVFDGTVLDDRYSGGLSLDGRAVSQFCAAKGRVAPRQCDPELNVRLLPGDRHDAAKITATP